MVIAVGSTVRLTQENAANPENNLLRPQPPRFGVVTAGADPFSVLFETGRLSVSLPAALLWEVLPPPQAQIDAWLNKIVRFGTSSEYTGRVVDVIDIVKTGGQGTFLVVQLLNNDGILEIDLATQGADVVVLEDR